MAKEKENIPEKIKEAFKELSEFKGKIKYLGMKSAVKWYVFDFLPVNGYIPDTGFPNIYGLKEGKLQTVNERDALKIANSFVEN